MSEKDHNSQRVFGAGNSAAPEVTMPPAILPATGPTPEAERIAELTDAALVESPAATDAETLDDWRSTPMEATADPQSPLELPENTVIEMNEGDAIAEVEPSPSPTLGESELTETISTTGAMVGVDIVGAMCPFCKSTERSHTHKTNELLDSSRTQHKWYIHQCKGCQRRYRQHTITRKISSAAAD